MIASNKCCAFVIGWEQQSSFELLALCQRKQVVYLTVVFAHEPWQRAVSVPGKTCQSMLVCSENPDRYSMSPQTPNEPKRSIISTHHQGGGTRQPLEITACLRSSDLRTGHHLPG